MIFLPKPKFMVLFLSFRCNLKCTMCYCWVKGERAPELSLEGISTICKDSLLNKNVEIINITGGEPTLRFDLDQIIRLITTYFHQLRRIDISTNGVDTQTITDTVERALAVLLPAGVELTANISIDGLEETHEKVRGQAGIFRNIAQTIEALKELMLLYPNFKVGLNMTVSRLNVHALEQVRNFAQGKGIGLSFTIAAISDIGVESYRIKERFEMDDASTKEAMRFFEELVGKGLLDKSYARFLIFWLKTGIRRSSCAFKEGKALLIEPDGKAYLCGNFKDFFITNILKEQLSHQWRASLRRAGSLAQKCRYCNSNCYIHET
ncbi:MAG: radical SAM protein [Candidatus Omnitrophota bacterium]|nr:MAG: radical SAM protein [Candidatus Omnitrophota bacterium]